MNRLFILSLVVLGFSPSWLRAELRVAAATAYLSPDSGGARVMRDGIRRWTDPKCRVIWYGQLKQSGQLNARVALRLKPDATSRLRLHIAGQTRELAVEGTDSLIAADFGLFDIAQKGYQSFALESLNTAGQPAGDLEALVLEGPATKKAHFNLKQRRNAASVHLFYPVSRDNEVSAFYCEMTGVEDPLWTYYMACGWHRGYFGMQVNSPSERRIIFSVWDSGGEAIDRKKVADEDRVTLIAKGEGVYSGSFGNEGTGGHSHYKFKWMTGERQRFLVTAEPVDATHTIYAGYYYRPDQQKWMLISSWKAPQEGKYLRGLYSFSENFVGRNGNVVRKALYGNQWIRDAEGEWSEVTRARFSHDATGKRDRLDRFMGLEGEQFFLSHGGYLPGFTESGTLMDRPATNRSPQSMTLPPLPAPRPSTNR